MRACACVRACVCLCVCFSGGMQSRLSISRRTLKNPAGTFAFSVVAAEGSAGRDPHRILFVRMRCGFSVVWHSMAASPQITAAATERHRFRNAFGYHSTVRMLAVSVAAVEGQVARALDRPATTVRNISRAKELAQAGRCLRESVSAEGDSSRRQEVGAPPQSL